jgi:hypothetical protein
MDNDGGRRPAKERLGLIALAERVFELAAAIEPPSDLPSFSAIEDAARRGGHGPKPWSDGERRRLQAQAYAATLDELGLIDERAVYVDLGAGSGLVSEMIHASMATPDGAVAADGRRDQTRVAGDRASAGRRGSFVLVDRRQKVPPHPEMCQLCIEIGSLRSAAELRAAAPVAAWPARAPIVVFANHLCGSALDRSIELFVAGSGAGALAGFLAATCCHDQAVWAEYCNQPFFIARGIGGFEFDQLAAWASLAPRRGKAPAERSRVRQAAAVLGRPLDECEQLGLAARLLIDSGRARRLEGAGLGLRAALRRHVPFNVTADNVLIVAAGALTIAASGELR